MKSRYKILVIFLLVIIPFCIFGQGNKKLVTNKEKMQSDTLLTDTIISANQVILIDIPELCYKTRNIQEYEEGFFVTYFYFDNCQLFIHLGSMVDIPFYTSIDSFKVTEKLSDNSYSESYRGIAKNKYFREDYYELYGMTVTYRYVPLKFLPLFDKILNSVKITPRTP